MTNVTHYIYEATINGQSIGLVDYSKTTWLFEYFYVQSLRNQIKLFIPWMWLCQIQQGDINPRQYVFKITISYISNQKLFL